MKKYIISIIFLLALCACQSKTVKPTGPTAAKTVSQNTPTPLIGKAFSEDQVWQQLKKSEREDKFPLQTECPFIGLSLDKKLYHDYRGYRIYTCCKGCLKIVKKMPHEGIRSMLKKSQRPHLIPTVKTPVLKQE